MGVAYVIVELLLNCLGITFRLAFRLAFSFRWHTNMYLLYIRGHRFNPAINFVNL
ncbi:hypothetical protein BDV19DRAFT_375325, partial [Aspergillus venezuelensis]